MCVRLNGVFSNTFGVSNGIRQSGVLFSVYIDELLPIG